MSRIRSLSFPSLGTLWAVVMSAALACALLSGRAPHAAGPASASPGGAAGLQGAVIHAAQIVSPSVVNIDTTVQVKEAGASLPGGQFFHFQMPGMPEFNMPFGATPDKMVPARGQGSGLIVSRDGLILTNEHVVHGATDIQVTLADQRKFKAKVVGADRLTDIAVLKIEAHGLAAATLGDSDRAPIGTFVIAVGNPYGFDHTMTMGVLSGRRREIPELGREMHNLLQTDAAINPGNSGGPLADLDGRVLGINTAIIRDAQGMGFAIPINSARKIMDELVAHGKVVRPFIGVFMQPVTDAVAEYLHLPRTEGVLVQSVVPDSPAQKAGLARGDVIVSIDGHKVTGMEELQAKVRAHKIGDQIALQVWSDDRLDSLKLKLQQMPSE